MTTPYFAGWSPWSEPYQPTAQGNIAPITSPSPRKFMQVRVDISSNDPEVTARVKRLHIDLAPPISTELAGELAVVTEMREDLVAQTGDYGPPWQIPPLEHQPFSYFLRAAGPDPNVAGVAEGFDEMLLLTPTAAELVGVRLGTVSVTEVGGGQASQTKFARAFVLDEAEGVFKDRDNGLVLPVYSSKDSLRIVFPESINKGFGEKQNALVEVQFRTPQGWNGVQGLCAGFAGCGRNFSARGGGGPGCHGTGRQPDGAADHFAYGRSGRRSGGPIGIHAEWRRDQR